MEAIYYFGEGVIASPHVAFKICAYVVPWFLPSIIIGKTVPEKGKSLEKEEIELDAVGFARADLKMDKMYPGSLVASKGNVTKTDIIPYKSLKEEGTSMIPNVSIKLPTLGEIGTRAMTAVMFDIPIYTAKHLYNSPLPTVIALYAILPTGVWTILAPKLIYYLPKLL